MERDWDCELLEAKSNLHLIKQLLDELSEQDKPSMLRIKPVITILEIGCDFIAANIDVIREQLARP